MCFTALTPGDDVVNMQSHSGTFGRTLATVLAAEPVTPHNNECQAQRWVAWGSPGLSGLANTAIAQSNRRGRLSFAQSVRRFKWWRQDRVIWI